MAIFSSAYDFIQSDPSQLAVLKNEYVTFSDNLLKYIASKNKGDQINSDAFFFSGVLDVKNEIPYG